MSLDRVRQAREWADKVAPYPRLEPKVAAFSSGLVTASLLATFSMVVGLSDRRALPALIGFSIAAAAIGYADSRAYARRHAEAYREAYDSLEREEAG